MEVRFDKIIFQNVLSFGNVPTEFSLEEGLNLITGKNGSGKSAFIDALSFVLYGLPYRKIRIEELINRKNKKNLHVFAYFTVNQKDKYIIERGLKPDLLRIFKNGIELELLSSKKLNQEEIDRILGINYTMFRQIISLAVNYNKPFLSLPIQDKRDIIEQIFNIKVFGSMLKILKGRVTDLKIKSEINNKTVSILEENIKSTRKRIKEIKTAIKNFEKEKQCAIEKVQTKIDSRKLEKTEINKEIKKVTKKIEKIYDTDSTDLNKYLSNSVNKSINTNNHDIKNAEKNIDSLNSQDGPCPLCNTTLTEEHKQNEIKRLKEIVKINKNELKELKLEKKEVQLRIVVINESASDKREHENNLIRFQDKLTMIETDLENLKNRKKDEKAKKLDFKLDNIEKEFEVKVNEYKLLFKEIKNNEKKKENYDTILNVLSETGIKSYLFKKLVPILNKRLNDYIQLFDLPVMVQFDEFMNEKISNLDNLNQDLSYYSYSEGEKKRLDMSVLMSFIDITKIVCNWKCNLLIMDELLDSAVDEEGLEKMIVCLKDVIDRSKTCGYVISHRLQDTDHFTSKCKLKKKQTGFSYIEKIF